jgi:DNA-binding MarR family transcriptional regulator
MAHDLGWHRRTVTAALERLEALGEVRLRRGRGHRGTYVAFLRDGQSTRVPVWVR